MDDVEFYGAKGAEGFRTYLLKKFGSIVAGWRHMDSDENGRLTFQEFCAQCRRMGYHGHLLRLWRELDVNLTGTVSLAEIDLEAGKMMGSFKVALIEKYGDLLCAWRKGLDTNGSGRIEEKEIASCLEDLGLRLNAKKLFDCLRSSPNGKGLTLAEFDAQSAQRLYRSDLEGITAERMNKEFLEDVPGISENSSLPACIQDKPVRGIVQKWRKELLERETGVRQTKERAINCRRGGLHTAHGFKRALLKRCGSLVGAWNEFLDLDGNGRLSFGEFCLALHRLGIHGDVQGLWKELDSENRGFLLLGDIDAEADAALSALRSLCIEKHGSMLRAWLKDFDIRGLLRLSEEDFIKGCEQIGYEGNAKRLFRIIRPERDRRFLTLRDFDTKANNCIMRGDFRMITEGAEPSASKASPLEKSFEDRQVGGAHIQLRRGLAVSRQKEFRRACLEANIPDRLIDTPEEFEQLCIRTYGSMSSAWRLCLDYDQNGKLTFNEFCSACRRIGYGGSPKALWKHYDADKNGHISLEELDKDSHETINSFLLLLAERYGHIDRAWKVGFGKDPHESIDQLSLKKACSKLGYPHSSQKLWKCLQPLPGRLSLTIWDLDPICARKRARGDFGLFVTTPKSGKFSDPSHGDLTGSGDDAVHGEEVCGGKSGTIATPSAISRGKASSQTSPFVSKWEIEDQNLTVGVPTCTTLIGSMQQAMRRKYGTTVAAWRLSLDSNAMDAIRYADLCRGMHDCDFPGQIRNLWRELTGDSETIPSGTLTFKQVDPTMQSALSKARDKLVARFGCLHKAWKEGFVREAGGKERVDLAAFVRTCEQSDISIKNPSRLFRLFCTQEGQRSISLADFEVLLIGVPPAGRCHLLTGSEEGEAQSSAPRLMKLSPPAPENNARKLIEQQSQDWHAKNFNVCSLDAFKRVLILRYGSLFSAWRKAFDTDDNGVVVQSDWMKACRLLGLSAGSKLWGELVKDLGEEHRGAISLKELDSDLADQFEAFGKLLVKKYGNTREGWRKCFEQAEPRTIRVEELKFVKQCRQLDFCGDASKFFRQLRPEPARLCLIYSDLWPVSDPNRNALFQAEVTAEGMVRSRARLNELKGTCGGHTFFRSNKETKEGQIQTE
eukprot:TRINITY_DN34492_c0_g1_i1.p1 TRINITY_DN34492_c0_g1~~TRINITY_DN34492_c0_g1_i1.p1  ORF type:complete len:1264 (-),score=148.87 TRINITY_DN34492_c0_g1_i1:23-3382(-)